MCIPSFFAFPPNSSATSFGAARYVAAEGNKEAEALLKWKASLDDNHSQSVLSSWVGSSPCKWLGITCDNSGSVADFSLPHFGLRGTLQSFNFSSFPNLLTLNLKNNSLYGTIPLEIGLLTSLNVLYLDKNNLTDLIPSSIENLRNLSFLNIAENNLSGSVPREIGQLESLVFLGLSFNNLSGSLPPEMNNLTHLMTLHLSLNNFTGHLPRDLCLGGLLVNFTVVRNHFSGPIPKSLRNCTSLFRVRLEGNQLTGNISEDFGLYPNLNYMESWT
jgi:Leucine-rich repeat (LRR) protein